jgi:hypothetical protein
MSEDLARPYTVVRLQPLLKPYIPIIGTGLRILLSTWVFPDVQRDGARNTRVTLDNYDRDQLNYVLRHAGRSATEVISAALVYAQRSNVRPPNAVALAPRGTCQSLR